MRYPFLDQINPTWSPCRSGAALGVNNASASSFTVGVQFNVARPNISCVGIRFYGVATVAKTVRCKLYDNAGTLLASNNFAISSTGLYEATFTTPIALTAFALYRACIWQSDGLNYYAFTLTSANPPARPFYAGGVVVYNNVAINSAGDVAPSGTASAEGYAVEPMLAGT
jgi:hypothetical protein